MQKDRQEHQRRAERIETLIQDVSAFSDLHTRAVVEELVQSLLDMYGDGLKRILELTMQTEATGSLVTAFMNDELIDALLLLHGLHPVDIETRIVQALDEVRPYLKSHGGNVELISVANGVARLRLEGSCHGCASSAQTLKSTIEEAIYKVAPDLDTLEVEGVSDLQRQPERVAIPVTFVPSAKSRNLSGKPRTL